ncbi:MAP7 domain-containing protein 2 isoform X2 [Pygocentrus nattereri]|uniref:MAP7 domain-containing protein 2 isoform X2 n=1 Tax=Pygocentrus nattereri TaxID=42514 RepID=UPI0008144C70|nr:MAP7 domain-containing protein 2 isoform X2 [Pygocentrus nattereri]
MATVVESPSGAPKKDRARLVKERRQEREKIHAVREQELWEKEYRAKQQYERSLEERGRRLEVQRQREEIRRAAVQEKRKQRGEEDKERLEALMRRSTDRGLQPEQRPKRWTWGGPPGSCEGVPKIVLPTPAASASLTNDPAALPPASQSRTDFMIPPESPDPNLIKSLSSSSTALAQTEKASPSPHRSLHKASPSRADRKKTNGVSGGPLDESQNGATTPKTPQTEKPGGERGFNNALMDSSVKRLESPTTPTRNSIWKNPSTPKRSKSCRSRIQSPCSPGQYPTSPMRHRATTPSADSIKRWDGEEKVADSKGYSTLDRKTSRTEKIPKSASKELGHNAESPVTPTGKAGTTDAEEASRLLAERRRLARVQKEQEEKQRMEEERLRMEELQRKQEEERVQQEQAARQAEEERQRQDEERRQKEVDDRRQKERRLKELQDQLDREREEAFQRVQREAERKQREREQLKLQEEQERLQRKKRIEEIMKRTRKTDAEPKKDEVHIESSSPMTPSVLEPGDATLINGQTESSTFAEVKNNESPSFISTASPVINLEALEAKCSATDDLSDGVQSMDVSPVSRDEPIYSPVSEGSQNTMRNSQALDQLLDLTGHPPYPKAPAGAALGDCNKNLIQGFSSAATGSALIQSLGPTMEKLSI